MTKGHFYPFQVPIQGPRGPKMAIFYGKVASKGRASSRVGQPTWKVSSAPYHIQEYLAGGLVGEAGSGKTTSLRSSHFLFQSLLLPPHHPRFLPFLPIPATNPTEHLLSGNMGSLCHHGHTRGKNEWGLEGANKEP